MQIILVPTVHGSYVSRSCHIAVRQVRNCSARLRARSRLGVCYEGALGRPPLQRLHTGRVPQTGESAAAALVAGLAYMDGYNMVPHTHCGVVSVQ